MSKSELRIDKIWSTLYEQTTEFSWNPNASTTKLDRPQHVRPATCVIAQQNSSATFASIRLYYSKEKFGARIRNVIISIFYLLTPWSRVLLEKLTGFAANQEIFRILWNNPKVHYRTHKCRPLFSCCMMPPLKPLPPPKIRVGEYFTSGLFCLQRKHLACEYFITFCFSRGGVVSASPNPHAGGPPLVGCPRLLIQFICSYLPYWRLLLHPQPEDTPCRGDRDPQTRRRSATNIKSSITGM